MNWLNKAINDADWSYAEFAKRGGISKTLVSSIFSGKRNVTANFCKATAKALGVDEVFVLYRANLLKRPKGITDEDIELLEIVSSLSKEKKNKLKSFAKFLQNEPE